MPLLPLPPLQRSALPGLYVGCVGMKPGNHPPALAGSLLLITLYAASAKASVFRVDWNLGGERLRLRLIAARRAAARPVGRATANSLGQNGYGINT